MAIFVTGLRRDCLLPAGLELLSMPEPQVTAAEAIKLSKQELAERVRDRMHENDYATRALSIAIVEVGPGTSRARMTVRRDMLNGFAICHGGLITTLADTAFAYACNAHNEVTVASGLSVDFLAPANEGDVLDAECHEQSARGRTGIYDVAVSNQRGERVALFRGRSYRLRGKAVVDVHDDTNK
jgi:acyl-CoA thioesterase